MIGLLAWAGLVLPAKSAAASPSQLADLTAGVNGTVYDTVQVGDRTFLGGEFSWAGPQTFSAVPVDATTGVRTGLPRVNGPVFAAARDATSGWYVGGQFTFAGGKTRNNAARISSTGGVSAWDPSVTGAVQAIAAHGSVVYLGGSFSSVGGQSRSNLAAVSSDTGAVLSWNPGINNTVQALAVSADGATVYAAGSFGVRAIDASSGSTRWASGPTGAAAALAVSNDTVYVGGDTGAVAIDAATGSVVRWTAVTDGAVRSVAAGAGVVYLGGAFTTVAGTTRGNIAAVDAVTGAVTSWNPGANAAVDSIQVSADATTVFAGGDFTSFGGQARNRTAAALVTDASLTGWHPSADAEVKALAVAGTRVLVGGLFTMLNGLPRRNAAAISSSGEVDPSWNPSPDDVVYAIDSSSDGTLIFLGGKFINVGTAARNKLAAVNNTTGAVLSRTAWPTGANGNVRAIEVSGQRMYLGGAFTRMAGFDTGRLAALNVTNGAVDTSFTPNPSGTIRAIAVSPDGTKVYAGGEYSTIGGSSRPGAAELDANSGALTGFAPTDGGVVLAVGLTPDGSRLFFSTSSNRTYAYDPVVSNSPVYVVRTGGDVQAMAVSGTEVYIGGHFTTMPVEKLARMHAASFYVATGLATAWNPGPDGVYGVWSMEITPSALLIGGDFLKVGGKAQPGFARFTGTP